MELKRVDPQRGTVVIPKHLRLKVEWVEVVRRNDGVIELRPQVPMDAAQTWFWSERWQQMEREVDSDVEAGRVRAYDDADSFLDDLELSV
ncbi:MAG: AbrB/MazE/SpoVT family DNA-binding domain-containing protein [Chloroflexota bacterium]